jgi:hypothetical protein
MVLRNRTRDRYEEYVGTRDRLSNEIESKIARIIKYEIEGLNDINRQKEQLKARYDFSRLDAFKAIDHYRMNSILRDDLKIFLNRNGIYATALDVDNLMRRMDQDKDGRLTYSEFCDYLEKSSQSQINKQDQSYYTPVKERSESAANENRYSKTDNKEQ